MVAVAEMGRLPALCGQELPVALWVDAPVHPPTPGDGAWAALLPAGSGQHGGAACCVSWQRAGLEGQAIAGVLGCTGTCHLGLVALTELAHIQGHAGCCGELDGDDSAWPGASSYRDVLCLG